MPYQAKGDVMRNLKLLLASIMVISFIPACGGEEEPPPVVCAGDQVAVENGTCVPLNPCEGDDVMLNEEGKCVPRPSLFDSECAQGYDFIVRNSAHRVTVPTNISTLYMFNFMVSYCRDLNEKGFSLIVRSRTVDRDYEESNDYDATGLILPDGSNRFSDLRALVGEEVVYQQSELRGTDWRGSALFTSEMGNGRKAGDKVQFQITATVNQDSWAPYSFVAEMGPFMSSGEVGGLNLTNEHVLDLE